MSFVQAKLGQKCWLRSNIESHLLGECDKRVGEAGLDAVMVGSKQSLRLRHLIPTATDHYRPPAIAISIREYPTQREHYS
jgi:hypothetical protein